MANTSVLLINNDGVYVPSVPSVAVNAGDTVSFATNDGSAAALFFSPGAAAVLSPAPGSAAQVPAGGNASFTFTSSSAGAYSMFAGASGDSAPSSFPNEVSQSLSLLINDSAGTPPFVGPHNTTNPGS
jgi:hypothetical protein